MKGKGSCVRNRRELAQAARLAADSFAERHAGVERSFAAHVGRLPGVGLEHVRVVRQRGKIVALVALYEKTVRIGRARLKMGGLGYVCAAPLVRGQGLATKCLGQAIRYLEANGYHWSMLFGIERFYRRAGYVGCIPSYRLYLPVRELSGLRTSLVARPYEARDERAMLELHEQSAQSCVCTAVRTVKTVREELRRRSLFPRLPDREDGVVVFHPKRKRQEVRAYLLWRSAEIQEAGIRPGDEVAAKAVLAWGRDRKRDALEKELQLRHGPDHPLTQYAMRYNHKLERAFSWTGNGMGRILNVTAFLEALSPELEARLNRAGMDGQCHLHLTVHTDPDEAVKRPRQVTQHTLVLGAGHQFMLKNRPHYWLRIVCSAQTLLQLVLGVLPQATLQGMEVEGEANLIPVLFPRMDPEMFALDHF